MENSKLFSLLRTFSRKEMRLFDDFLCSPYHNTNRQLNVFFDAIKKHHPGFSSPRLEKEKLHRAVFGKMRFDDVRVRGLMSDVLELAEEFLALENMKKQGFSTDAFLLNELDARDQDALYVMRARRYSGEETHDQPLGRWGLLNHYLVAYEQMFFLWKTHNDKKEKLIGTQLFEQPLQRLSEFFIHEGSAIDLRMRIMKQIIAYSDTAGPYLSAVSELAGALKKKPLLLDFIRLQAEVAGMKNEQAYQALKTLVLEPRVQHFSFRDLETCFTLLNDYCNYQYMTGSRDYVADSFLFLKRQMELGIHMRNGHMSETLFSNIVIEAVKNKAFDWARSFIHEHARYLPAGNRDDTIGYCLGTVYEQEGKLREALYHFSRVSKPPLQISINIKCQFVKIYYARGDLPQVLATCAGFSKFLKKNPKYPDSRKKPILDFIAYAGLLTKFRLGKIDRPIAEIVREMEAHSNLGLKGWLVRMGKELEAKENGA
jgi:hypothetical protein